MTKSKSNIASSRLNDVTSKLADMNREVLKLRSEREALKKLLSNKKRKFSDTTVVLLDSFQQNKDKWICLKCIKALHPQIDRRPLSALLIEWCRKNKLERRGVTHQHHNALSGRKVEWEYQVKQ